MITLLFVLMTSGHAELASEDLKKDIILFKKPEYAVIREAWYNGGATKQCEAAFGTGSYAIKILYNPYNPSQVPFECTAGQEGEKI